MKNAEFRILTEGKPAFDGKAKEGKNLELLLSEAEGAVGRKGFTRMVAQVERKNGEVRAIDTYDVEEAKLWLGEVSEETAPKAKTKKK